MLIIAHHNVSDPEGFWTAAKQVATNLTGSLKLHGVYPATDLKTGTCLWEADSVKEVQDFLDTNAGKFAKNLCYEVKVNESMGLPKIPMQEERLN